MRVEICKQATLPDDPRSQRFVLGRIHLIKALTQDCHSGKRMSKGRLVGGRIYTISKAADNKGPEGGDLPDQNFNYLFSVLSGGASPYDRHDPGSIQVGIPLVKEHDWRFLAANEALRIVFIGYKQAPDALAVH